MVMVNLYHEVSDEFISETSYVELIKLRSAVEALYQSILLEKSNVSKAQDNIAKNYDYYFSAELHEPEYRRLGQRYNTLMQVDKILSTNLHKICRGIYHKGPNILHAYDTCNKSYDIGTAKWDEINKYRDIANISDEIPVNDLSLIFDKYEDEETLTKRFYEC